MEITLKNPKPTYSDFVLQMREALARKVSNNIWGEGFDLQSDNEAINKKYKEFKEINDLDNLFMFVERQCSKFGKSIITINPTEDGKNFMLNTTDPFWFTGVGKSFIQPQLAVIYQRVNVSQSFYFIKTTYTPKYVKSEVYSDYQNNYSRVFEKEQEILKQFRLKRYWEHNLGFVPVVEVFNIPFYDHTFGIGMNAIELADWVCGTIFEELAWKTMNNLKKELNMCHSRIAIDGATQEQIAKFKMEGAFESLEEQNDLIINAINGQVTFQPGVGDFTKYTNTLDHIFDFYYKLAGSSRFSEGGGAQKTVAETSTIRSSMVESIKQKIRLREVQIGTLIKKALACYGVLDYYNEEDFSFKIVGNITRDETAWIDNKLKLIQGGVITVVDFIQELFNISKTEAEQKFEEIQKFNEENGIITGMSGFDNPLENGEAGNFNQDTGEHKSADKKGLE